jgi:hypothetical protein
MKIREIINQPNFKTIEFFDASSGQKIEVTRYNATQTQVIRFDLSQKNQLVEKIIDLIEANELNPVTNL